MYLCESECYELGSLISRSVLLTVTLVAHLILHNDLMVFSFTGPMVWYQKFEYAISHWLQKATEHTIGCVLCSPGCFSLFRGSALCEKNVLKRYTTLPSEAKHHVQYDQGKLFFSLI